MSERRRKKGQREKDLTSRYFADDIDGDRLESHQRFTDRSKNAQQNKMERTAVLRAGNDLSIDVDTLPIGQVILVHSRYIQVEHADGIHLCTVRKTLSKLSETSIVVGDNVRFRDSGARHESSLPEGVIELILPRKTILTRTGSFHTHEQHPIVANADQMLIVASLLRPIVKWGLIDRMLIAAQSGGLTPTVCLNKIDLAEDSDAGRREFTAAQQVLAHYQSMGIATLQCCASRQAGVDKVAEVLAGKTTVLAGHSGVGKSTLIAAIQPGLDIRIGEISAYTEKGRHTTTSARRYPLQIGGHVIDTPGVKLFGLWDVRKENLLDFFPDVKAEIAPSWRVESYQRIAESL